MARLKLASYLEVTKQRMQQKLVEESLLIAHAKRVYHSGRYNSFVSRIVWDLLNAAQISWHFKADFDNADATDEHIESLGKQAVKELYPELWAYISNPEKIQ